MRPGFADEQKPFSIVDIECIPREPLATPNDASAILRSLFRLCLTYANEVIDAFRATGACYYAYNITAFDLPEDILIIAENREFLYRIPRIQTTPLEVSFITPAGQILALWSNNPVIKTQDRFLESARSHRAREQFAFAIVDLQTSFEVFVRNSLRLALTKQAVSSEEVVRRIDFPFRNVIEHELSGCLDTNLSFQTNSIISSWRANLYDVRNRIVHEGLLYVDERQANEAFSSYAAARKYLADLLVQKGFLTENGRVELRLFWPEGRTEESLRAADERLNNSPLLLPSKLPETPST
jgi:hypothetical protein